MLLKAKSIRRVDSPDGRVYEINGHKCVAVSTVLDVVDWGGDDWKWSVGKERYNEIMNKAGEFGTLIHTQCAKIAEGKAIRVHPENTDLMIGAAKEWFDIAIEKVLGTEVTVWNKDYLWAGTADLVAILRGDKLPSVIDWKTGQPGDHTRLQLAGYRGALESHGIKTQRSIAVYLDKRVKGKRHVVEHKNHHKDFKAWMNALSLWMDLRGGQA